MSNCGCEGSCPACSLGEVDNHKCNRCGREYCDVCHGIKKGELSPNIDPCTCEQTSLAT